MYDRQVQYDMLSVDEYDEDPSIPLIEIRSRIVSTSYSSSASEESSCAVV